jgi:hypothetical protein
MSGVLLGRRHESHVLDQLLETARGGQSQVLVLEGEAGIGKTALLENVATAAAGFTVVRASGVESEMQLAFAALHQLCGPMLDRVAHLPPPQRDALEVAFGLTAGPSADRFVVGLAVLSLLSEAATERPLLCLVDDAQWLDETSLQALAFVARRLLAESIAIVFGTRTPGDALKGLPRLSMVGLDSDNARALLESALQAPLDPVVGDRIIAESAGNPLALLELPRALTPGKLAGGFGLLGAVSLSGQIEDSFERRARVLPTATQRLLVVAAAEPTADPRLTWRAAEILGIATDAAAAAESAGLLRIDTRVTFRHPLVRSAIYQAASIEER